MSVFRRSTKGSVATLLPSYNEAAASSLQERQESGDATYEVLVTRPPISTPTQPGPSSARPIEPVVLAWSPPNSRRGTDMKTSPNGRFVETYAFSFSQLAHNSMLLLPSASAEDSRPRYHISSTLNVFFPLSWTTTVRRGGSEGGEYVGEFTIGSTEPDIVRVGEYEMDVEHALHFKGSSKGSGPHTELFSWKFNVDLKLRWKHRFDYEKDPPTPIDWACELCARGKDNGIIIATYQRHSRRERPGQYAGPRPVKHTKPPSMVVQPEGMNHLDDIVMSLLLFERARLAPVYSKYD